MQSSLTPERQLTWFILPVGAVQSQNRDKRGLSGLNMRLMQPIESLYGVVSQLSDLGCAALILYETA